MDQTKLRAAMKAITTGVGRSKANTGGVRGEAAVRLRTRLTEVLTAGTRTNTKGVTRAINGATTCSMAARLLAVGGEVPEVVRSRFTFSLALPAVREVAEAVGCSPDALVAALVGTVAAVAAPPAAQAASEATAQAQDAIAAVEAPVAPPARAAGGRRGR
jgi:hypothetical protein